MNTPSITPLIRNIVRFALISVGLFHALIGLAQLLAPQWFWQNIGYFPPFNRHYVGDLGSFELPLGLALLWAVRDPRRNVLLIACAVAADLIHALNHVYDDVLAGLLFSTQTVILLLGALAFALVLWPLRRDAAKQP